MIETDRVGLSLLANKSAPLKDSRLKKELKAMVGVNQDSFRPSPIPRSIEKFDGKNERVNASLYKQLCFTFH